MTRANMLRQEDICCSQPPADPNYTVCFPAQQATPVGIRENPFYYFAARRSYWTYTIQIDGDGGQISDLSHWDLQICQALANQGDPGDFTVEVSTDGVTYSPFSGVLEVLPGDDPSLNPPVAVTGLLKIDFENEGQATGTTVFYRITILDPVFFDLAAEPGTVIIKHGTNPDPGYQVFNSGSCGSNVLPTPSVGCNRVTPMFARGRGIPLREFYR
jgi:hypothetical protein